MACKTKVMRTIVCLQAPTSASYHQVTQKAAVLIQQTDAESSPTRITDLSDERKQTLAGFRFEAFSPWTIAGNAKAQP